MQKLCILFIILITITTTGQNQKTYSLDTHNSVLNWKGSYSFYFSEHKGTVQFKEGQLLTEDEHIIGGSFIIDMTTITNEDHKLKQGPVEHLKNKDFFNVETYPEAKIVFTKVEYFVENNEHRILADLTIKGITLPIKFHATANAENKNIIAKIIIDRTRWGISYNSKLKEESISDAIEFETVLSF